MHYSRLPRVLGAGGVAVVAGVSLLAAPSADAAVRRVDLAIRVSASGPLRAGHYTTFTIKVTNKGKRTAQSVGAMLAQPWPGGDLKLVKATTPNRGADAVVFHDGRYVWATGAASGLKHGRTFTLYVKVFTPKAARGSRTLEALSTSYPRDSNPRNDNWTAALGVRR